MVDRSRGAAAVEPEAVTRVIDERFGEVHRHRQRLACRALVLRARVPERNENEHKVTILLRRNDYQW